MATRKQPSLLAHGPHPDGIETSSIGALSNECSCSDLDVARHGVVEEHFAQG